MMTTPKLCECGGTPEVRTWEFEEDDEGKYTIDLYFVKCSKCHKGSHLLDFTDEDAVVLWNESYADMPKDELGEEPI